MIKTYHVKAIFCGEFIQLYKYEDIKFKHFCEDGITKERKSRAEEGESEYKNLVRSKNSMSRLIMTNYNSFKTFITLTFSVNLHDIKKANKLFHNWVSNTKKRLKSDFLYIAVPEFQKRGAIHYHLLTNIDYTDFSILCKDEKRLWSPYSKTWQEGRPIPTWKHGFSLAKDITSESKDIIGYMAKYMLKDFDNRLFGKHKYLASLSLNRPKEIYYDLSNSDELAEYEKIVYNGTVRYKNTYFQKLSEKSVDFIELKASYLPTIHSKYSTSYNQYNDDSQNM